MKQAIIITGTPGTGKTTVVSTIIAMLLQDNPSLKIKLCAPTGKAASRMKESVADELKNIYVDDNVKAIMSDLDAMTIHRLLGVTHLSPKFRHNSKKQLDVDVLIIDEASMINQSLMTKLMSATKLETKVILLGDKDQLASVQEGAILADICAASQLNRFTAEFQNYCSFADLEIVDSENSMSNCTVELKKTHRFDDDKGIGKLKNAISDIEGFEDSDSREKFLNILAEKSDELKFTLLPQTADLEVELKNYIKNLKLNVNGKLISYLDYLNQETPEEAFAIMNEFKVLCSHRNSLVGVTAINYILQEIIIGSSKGFKKGTPIMICENNSTLELYNGDIGLVWPDTDGKLKAFFPNIENPKDFRSFSLSGLPNHNVVFAMTIHKSQGSGFNNVLIILPEKDSPLLTKELIYTGITRAKSHCSIWGNKDTLLNAVSRKTIRKSGLKKKLG